jgi:hypothetical protein
MDKETLIRALAAYDPLDEAVDTAEASRITGTPVTTLETLRSRGGGPEFIKRGRTVRYLRRDLLAWLQAHRIASTSQVRRGERGLRAA